VDSVHCPGCGAVVRPKQSWCSLCYRDLSPAKPLVTASQTGAPTIAKNLIDADIAGNRATNIAGIPRPASPSSQESLTPDAGPGSGGVDLSKASDADSELKDARKAWPCSCGTDVVFDADSCPTCGRAFLGELRGQNAPQRRGPAWLSAYLDASRPVRLAIAGVIASLVAFAIPGFIALFG
jgi:hypothetical protein